MNDRTDPGAVDWKALKRSIAEVKLPPIHRTDVRCGLAGCGRWCITAFDSADNGLWVVSHVDLPHMDEPGARWEDAVVDALVTVEQLEQPATGNRRRDLARGWALRYAMRGLVMLAPGPLKTGTIAVRHIGDDHPADAVEGTCSEHEHRIVTAGLPELRNAVRSNRKNMKASVDT